MSLRDVIDMITARLTAMNGGSVIANDIFRLNTMADATYPAVAWTQREHRFVLDSSLAYYSFSLIYVDRLLEDKSNEVNVQSAGIMFLGELFRQLAQDGLEVDGDVTFQTFNQRFLDDCAGVFANVTFSAPVDTLCAY